MLLSDLVVADGVIAHQPRLNSLRPRGGRQQDFRRRPILTAERGEGQSRRRHADGRLRERRLIREDELVGGGQIGHRPQEATDVHQALTHTLEIVRRLDEQSLGLLPRQRRHDLQRQRDGSDHQGRGVARAGTVGVEVTDGDASTIAREARRDGQARAVGVDVHRRPVVRELRAHRLQLTVGQLLEGGCAHADDPGEARGVVVGLLELGREEFTVVTGGRHHDDTGLGGAVRGLVQPLARIRATETERDDARSSDARQVDRIADQVLRRVVETGVEDPHREDLALRRDAAEPVSVFARSHERRDRPEVVGADAVGLGRLEDLLVAQQRVLILLDEVVAAGQDALDVVRVRGVAAVHDGDDHTLAGGVLPRWEHVVLPLEDLDLSLHVERVRADEEARRLEHLLLDRAGRARRVEDGVVAGRAALGEDAAGAHDHDHEDTTNAVVDVHVVPFCMPFCAEVGPKSTI